MFGVTVNYFSNENFPAYVRESTRFCISLLLSCSDVDEVVVVDGSETPDHALHKFCRQLSVQYLHAGRRLSFAETYNLGVAQLTQEWVATIASDVYVSRNTFEIFRRFIEAHPDLPIGCLIPYLSTSDLPGQSSVQPRVACRFPLMTLNLNIFRRAVLQQLGGIKEGFSGNFNDVVLAIQLRAENLDIFLVNAYAVHYGKLTINLTGTKFDEDRSKFFSDYPQYHRPDSTWEIDLLPLLHSRIAKRLYRACYILPVGHYRKRLVRIFMSVLPRIQKL